MKSYYRQIILLLVYYKKKLIRLIFEDINEVGTKVWHISAKYNRKIHM